MGCTKDVYPIFIIEAEFFMMNTISDEYFCYM